MKSNFNKMYMKKYIAMCVVVLGFMSCNNFLSKNPDNRTDIDSKEAIQSMLVSAYPDWSYVWMAELMSDNVTDVGTIAPYSDVTVQQIYNWQDVDDETQDTPAGYWNRAYNAISHANTVLEAIDRLVADGTYAESDLSAQRGEALMARAYAHFMLVNLFAEHYNPNTAATTLSIPYVTEVEKVPNVTYTRLSVQEVYDLIEKDIQAAMPYDPAKSDAEQAPTLISDAEMSNKSWHMNTKAAATFASRFYLWRGLKDKNDWKRVVHYADIALGNDPVAALRDWSLASSTMSGENAMSWDAFAQEYTRSRVSANLELKECISSGANDRAALYRYTMSDALQREIIGFSSDVFPTATRINHLFYCMALGYTTYDCYFIYKLKEEFQRDGVNANYGTPYVMYPLFVAEEALFNKAEALVMMEDYQGAIDLLDAYFEKRTEIPEGQSYSKEVYGVTPERIRALYSGTENHGDINPHYALTEEQKTYLKCLMRIRRTEFIHEGLRWFDIKRMHIEVRHANMNGVTNVLTPDDERRVLAIPEAALASGLLLDGQLPEVKKVQAVTVEDKPQAMYTRPKFDAEGNEIDYQFKY